MARPLIPYDTRWTGLAGLAAIVDYSKPELLKLLAERLARITQDELDVVTMVNVRRARHAASVLDERRN